MGQRESIDAGDRQRQQRGENRNAPAVIKAFNAAHPQMHISCTTAQSRQIVDLVASRFADLGIVDPIAVTSAVRVERRWQFRCVCAVPAGHPLAASGTVSAAGLAGESVIGLEREFLSRYASGAALAAVTSSRRPRIKSATSSAALPRIPSTASSPRHLCNLRTRTSRCRKSPSRSFRSTATTTMPISRRSPKIQGSDRGGRRGPVHHARIQSFDPRRPEERHRLGQQALRQEFICAQAFRRHRHVAGGDRNRRRPAKPAKRAELLQFASDECA
ncbi:hypothetical protein ATER59S_00722 [Aquamicrobium terrae]